MNDVFLSYAASDRERVRPLVGALQRQGWSVWWDRQILPGEYWPEVLEEALHASGVVVVVWTTSSVKSRWVRREAGEGVKRAALVPVFLDSVDAPLEFQDIQTANLVSWNGNPDHSEFPSVVEGIRRTLLSRKPAAQPDAATREQYSLSYFEQSLAPGGDLGSSDPHDLDWIQKLVTGLGKKAVPPLLAALKSPEPDRRGHAAFLLGLTGDPSVVTSLRPLLADNSVMGFHRNFPTVRACAAMALSHIGTDDARTALSEGYK